MSAAYLNGEYLPLEQANVSAMDRGFLFGDGVYEVIPVYGGHLFRLEEHLSRLNVSLEGIRLANPCSESEWKAIITELVRRNQNMAQDLSVYLQVTRGIASTRNHLFPTDVKQTIFLFCAAMPPVDARLLNEGASVVTLNDIRWAHRNIKAISLLGNILLRQEGADQGADEVILIDREWANECSVSNIFIVKEGVIVTPPKSKDLLPGITRDLVLELAQRHGLPCQEREITKAELSEADEIWLSSSTKEVVSVTKLDGKPVGDGQPGERWREMLQYFQNYKALLREGKAG